MRLLPSLLLLIAAAAAVSAAARPPVSGNATPNDASDKTAPSAPIAAHTQTTATGTMPLSAEKAQQYLWDAARAGETALVTDLLKAGAAVDAGNASGHTALILAAYNGHAATVAALLKAGADPNIGDKRGNTALMGAIFKNEPAVIETLLAEPRTQVNARNGAGQTAAMFAALFGKQELLEKLAARGADLKLADAAGQTAQRLAQQQGNAALALRIEELGRAHANPTPAGAGR